MTNAADQDQIMGHSFSIDSLQREQLKGSSVYFASSANTEVVKGRTERSRVVGGAVIGV